MKKLLVLLFSILISFNSYGEWEFLDENIDSVSFYIDKSKIKKHNGYLYFWVMQDNLIPTKTGTLSNKVYYQGDCDINRIKYLSYILYKQPMGEGQGNTLQGDTEWTYPNPNGMLAYILDYMCDYAK